MRAKFLDEHFHKEDEVRFFVAGSGLFTLHVDGKVYEVLCTQGDLIAVPDSTTHWFDMGPEPSRSEEHTSELQSLMRISYAVFCLTKHKQTDTTKKRVQD